MHKIIGDIMKANRTFSLDTENIDWLQKKGMNMSDFINSLLVAERIKEMSNFKHPSGLNEPELQAVYDSNKALSEKLYEEWDKNRVVVHGD